MTITDILDSTTCPYCGAQSSTKSGRTLHRKKCQKVKPNLDLMDKFTTNQVIEFGGKKHLVKKISEGLIEFKDGVVMTTTKVMASTLVKTPSSKSKDDKFKKPSEIPELNAISKVQIELPASTLKEWVNRYFERWVNQKVPKTKLKSMARSLFRQSGYVKYMRWTPEDLAVILKNK